MTGIFTCKIHTALKFKYFILLLIATLLNFNANSFHGNSLYSEPLNYSTPAFDAGNYSFSVSEETALGSFAGNVSASDADGDVLTYSIKSGNTNKSFLINSSTGSITIAKKLNYHSQDTFMLIVKVADPGGLSDEVSVIITIVQSANQPGVDGVTWGTAANQPYTVSESQGEVANGRLYTFGGFDSQKPSFTPTSRAYMYNPSANTWTSIAAMPPMNGTNYGGVTHAGMTTDGTDIYFGGGYTSNSSGTGQKFGTKEVWKYIVSENRYVRLPDLPIVIAAGQLEYLAGKLHHICGTNAARTVDLGDHYVLDLDNLASGWKVLAPLPNPRQHAGSVVYEGKIYFIGGQHGQDSHLEAQKEVHSYDPHKNIWTKMADLPVPAGATGRGHISSAAIIKGKHIVVLAGETSHSSGRTNMVSAYSPETNTWKNLTPLPQTRYSGVAANLGGLMYYTGGSKASTTYKEISSPSTQSITSLTLINAATDQPVKTIVSGDTFNLANIPGGQLNIVANTNPAKVGSVKFNLTGPQNITITENTAPYAMFGDDGSGDYKVWTPAPLLGEYTLTATPYSGSGASGTPGSAQTVIFTFINNQTQATTLSPVADAYVRGGSNANTNYGSDASLLIKGSPSSDFTRYIYLKFSLGSLSNVNSATLRLYGSNVTNSAGISVSAHGVDDDTWIENGINFNNKPAYLAPPLISVSVSNTAKYYEFDVTNFVTTQFNGNKVVSLVLRDPGNADVNLIFNSRQNAQNKPQLVVTSGQTAGKSGGYAVISTGRSVKDLALINLYDAKPSKVYPNPMHNTFNIEFPKDFKGGYNLQIVDPVGRIYDLGKSAIKPGGYNKIRIDLSKLYLKAGLYFLRINSLVKQAEVIKLMVE